jgi:hypothetical protein
VADVRKVKGTITGEIWETKAKGIPRRKLSDGRTETGKDVEDLEELEYEDTEPEVDDDIRVVDSDIEIQVEADDEGLDWQPASMDMEFEPSEDFQEIQTQALPEEEPTRGRQPPQTTRKDQKKLDDLFLVYAMAFDDNNYDLETKIKAISKIFSGIYDIRIETVQTLISPRLYSMMAFPAVALLLLGKKGAGGLLGSYRKMMKDMQSGGRQTQIDDVFGENNGPNQTQ